MPSSNSIYKALQSVYIDSHETNNLLLSQRENTLHVHKELNGLI